jgi:two-component system, NtrC family, response regulator AtoC
MLDVSGFQTTNDRLKQIFSNLDGFSQSNCLLISGEQGTGRRQLAQAICHHRKIHKMVRYLGEMHLSDISENQAFVIEELENFSSTEQRALADLIAQHPNILWIITASKEISQLVAKGLVSRELYGKAKIKILMPSLRERGDDVIVITEHILQTHAWIMGKVIRLTAEAGEALRRHTWPGNVSELERVIERAVTSVKGNHIEAKDLEIQSKGTPLQYSTLDEMEKKLIMQTLELTRNNKTQAARMLGISIRTLRNKLSQYKEGDQYESNV